MFSIVDRYKLWNCAAFGSCDDDNGGGGNDSGGGSNNNNNNDSTPTFNSLSEASEAGYHGEAVNIRGKGLQKVEFADDNYNQQMANVSAAANTGGGSNNNNTGGGGGGSTIPGSAGGYGTGGAGGSGVVIIKESAVAGSASGVWNMDAVYEYVLEGTWGG